MNGSKRGILLASFVLTDSEDRILEEVQFIANNLNLSNKHIFLLTSLEEPNKKILTYNAIVEKESLLIHVCLL